MASVQNNEQRDSIRNIKFENFVMDINDSLQSVGRVSSLSKALQMKMPLFYSPEMEKITPLDIIFNRNEMNEYAQIILKKAEVRIFSEKGGDPWAEKYSKSNFWGGGIQSENLRISAAKDFVSMMQDGRNDFNKVQFVFWSLMVLCVDKTFEEDNLTLVCDLIKMLKIQDEEVADITAVLKILFGNDSKNYEFNSARTQSALRNLIN